MKMIEVKEISTQTDPIKMVMPSSTNESGIATSCSLG
jgi:hypothetical protein